MYSVSFSRRFTRSLDKIERSGRFARSARARLRSIIAALRDGKPLPATSRDHALRGDMAAHRECHIGGDLLLLYKKDEQDGVIVLADIGTHSELFGS